jgi:hypothetical protein
MPLVRVKLQAASRYPLGQMLRVVRGHEEVGFSVVEAHVDPAYLFEAERPRSYLTQFVVDPARSSLSHGLLKRLDEERSDPGLSSARRSTPGSSSESPANMPSGSSCIARAASPRAVASSSGASQAILISSTSPSDIPSSAPGTVQHAEPAHDIHAPETLGHQHAKGEHVRSAPREAERRETLQAEVVGHPHEIPGAVEQGCLRPRVGVAVAGPIDADEEQPLPANPLRVVEARGEG